MSDPFAPAALLNQIVSKVEYESENYERALEASVKEENTAFSSIIKNLQLAWDSTSLGALKTCPRYYQYSIKLGLVPRSESAHLIFGQEFHAALEFYDRLRVHGAEHEEGLRNTVREIFRRTWKFDLRRPWTSDIPEKNRLTLIRAVVWYLEHFRDDPLEVFVRADGHPAVEMSFRLDIGMKSRLTGEQFLLCGHLDKVVKFQNKLWVVDRKTTKTALSTEYFERYSPDNQMSTYSVAGDVILSEPIAGLIIDACQVGVTFARFQRGFVHRSSASNNEWLKDLGFWLSLAEMFAERDYWPQNDKSCNMFGGCPYRPLCSADPRVRDRLEDMYSPRMWDPLKTREI